MRLHLDPFWGVRSSLLVLAAALTPWQAMFASARAEPENAQSALVTAQGPDLGRHLADRRGTAAIYLPADDRFARVDPDRAAERFTPCSTFKIPNTLIALAAGAVTLEQSHIPWDPVRDPRGEHWSDAWARDQDLNTALKSSVLWYYRELARRVGIEEYARELARLGYGNEDVSGVPDRFWLSSSLRISADEQVDFLRRLRAGGLGFDSTHIDFVRTAIVLEERPGARLSGKTGSCPLPDGEWIGWLVGYVDAAAKTGDGPWHPSAFFAVNVEAATWAEVAEACFLVARGILADLGVFPAGGEESP